MSSSDGNVRRLEHALNQTFQDYQQDTDSLECLGERLRAMLPGPSEAAALLNSVAHLADSSVALRRSHIHRNGFMKLPLMRGGADAPWRVRLHVWHGPVRDAQIHDHRWSFLSMVLIGELRVYNFGPRLEDKRMAPLHVVRLYDADENGQKVSEEAGLTRLISTSSYRINTGDMHTLYFTEPHLVEHAGSSTAATLVITAPPARDWSHSYRPDPPEAGVRVNRPREVSDLEARRKLTEIAALLTSDRTYAGGSGQQ